MKYGIDMQFGQLAENEEAAATNEAHHQDAIYPGQPWYDTKEQRIQAHGGAL